MAHTSYLLWERRPEAWIRLLLAWLILPTFLVFAGSALAEQGSALAVASAEHERLSNLLGAEADDSDALACDPSADAAACETDVVALEAGPGTPAREAGADAEEDGVILWYFWRENCPHCTRAERWLEELSASFDELRIRRIEVIDDPEGRARFIEMMADRGEQARAVPSFIFDDEVWVGFTTPLAEDIRAAIEAQIHQLEREVGRGRSTLDLGPLGTFELEGRPMVGATLLIAFVDGFNPCSLWVLTVLIAMVMGTRSRARIAAVGVTFLVVTASIYGVFIAGLFAALVVAGHLGWIQVVVAILALLFGLVNVKDFFAFGKGFSFSIPERFKPRIYKGGRSLRQDRPLLPTLAITVGLAAGVALIELPCTAGFPVVWTTLVSEAGIEGTGFAALLALYLLVYLSVELAILTVAVVTMRATRLQEEHGRTLKLFGGMIMVALAIVILVDPSIMEQLLGSLVVILLAAGASVAVMVGERFFRKRRERSGDLNTKGE